MMQLLALEIRLRYSDRAGCVHGMVLAGIPLNQSALGVQVAVLGLSAGLDYVAAPCQSFSCSFLNVLLYVPLPLCLLL